jgi:cytidylate kinase
MPHVIAVFGKSCVGKSVVAEELAGRLKWLVRHCGEKIKTRARELGVQVTMLPAYEHEAIDDETRSLVGSHINSVVIEGTFLDAVLGQIPDVLFVQLTCEGRVREERFIARSKDHASANDLGLRDASDIAHREMLYNCSIELSQVLTIDTTRRTVDEVVTEIINWLELN